MVKLWNLLPEDVVESETIITFKRHLDAYLNRQGTEDMDIMWTNEFRNAGQNGCCEYVGPKVLFLYDSLRMQIKFV